MVFSIEDYENMDKYLKQDNFGIICDTPYCDTISYRTNFVEVFKLIEELRDIDNQTKKEQNDNKTIPQ